MGLQGSLRDMSVADIIQVNCQDKKTASVTLISNGKEAVIYFKEGSVVHATIDQTIGEEAIYKILSWDEGEFVLNVGAQSPEVTIKRNWSGLLLEGAKRLDELSDQGEDLGLVAENSSPEKSEKLNTLLNQFINAFKFVDLAAVAGIDGFVKSGAYKESIEEVVLGGIGAAAYNFGKRALGLLKMDQFSYTLLKGESNTVFVSALNKYTVLIVVTDNSAELKMDQITKLMAAVAPLV
jgi:predicted regulator of Ras-like GTPase activity (Roadblock/LC7/MglB family)